MNWQIRLKANAGTISDIWEAFDRRFNPVDNEKLSENGVMAARTMNTLLHMFEAYTELYRVDKDKRISDSMAWMLDIFKPTKYSTQI